jgi:hypothetical protein
MSLANLGRYQRTLDGAGGVILTAMGLLLSASMFLVGA